MVARKGTALPFDVNDVPVLFWDSFSEFEAALGKRTERTAASQALRPSPFGFHEADRATRAQGTTTRNSQVASRIRCTMPDSRLARPVP
jgi:hypothetical protein